MLNPPRGRTQQTTEPRARPGPEPILGPEARARPRGSGEARALTPSLGLLDPEPRTPVNASRASGSVDPEPRAPVNASRASGSDGSRASGPAPSSLDTERLVGGASGRSYARTHVLAYIYAIIYTHTLTHEVYYIYSSRLSNKPHLPCMLAHHQQHYDYLCVIQVYPCRLLVQAGSNSCVVSQVEHDFVHTTSAPR